MGGMGLSDAARRVSVVIGTHNRPALLREARRYDIAFCLDPKYLVHAASVISSIAYFAPLTPFRFILLHSGITKARQSALESLVPKSEFHWIGVTEHEVLNFLPNEAIHHVSPATLLRLLLEELAPSDTERLLYLDADLTILQDIRPLWDVDLDGAPLGAVVDPDVDDAEFQRRWSLQASENCGYFNAGVLMIDMPLVRSEKLFSKATEFVLQHNPIFADQDGLNWAVWGRWHRLPMTWNFQRSSAYRAVSKDAPAELTDQARNISIIHFTGDQKPWFRGAYHPWAWLYWRALARTPYMREVAREHGIGPLTKARLWLRWQRRRPGTAIPLAFNHQ